MALGMGDPPATEPSIVIHINPPPKPTLPSKIDSFSASIYQASYKTSTLAVHVSSLLSAYQAEPLVDMWQQLEKGCASPSHWMEIVTINDHVLCNGR